MLSKVIRLKLMALMLATLPAVAHGQSAAASVRNDSDLTVSCRTSRHGSSRSERVTLRPGAIWRESGNSRRGWRIVCDAPVLSARYRLEPGRAYHIVPRPGAVGLMVRPI